MKKAEKIYKEFVELAKYYLKELDYYGESQFKHKPSPEEWSIGQIYDHLINGSQSYHVKEIRNCLSGHNGDTQGGKNFKGKIFFSMGKFPPFKFKNVSPGDYTPAQPARPDKVKDDLYRFIKLMNNLAREIDAKDSYEYKTNNPSFGMLNALEWYKLIEMHFRHHLKQKHKLDKNVRSYRKETFVERPKADLENDDLDNEDYLY